MAARNQLLRKRGVHAARDLAARLDARLAAADDEHDDADEPEDIDGGPLS